MIPNKVRNTDDLFTVWFQSVLLAKTQKKHCTKKLSFSLKIPSANVTKFAGNFQRGSL